MLKLFFCGLLFITLAVSAQQVSDSGKLVKMIIMNDNRQRPIADTKDFFWHSEKLNVVTFSGDLYYDLIRYRLQKLKIDTLVNNFSISAAVVFSWNEKSDTVYTDCFFRNWLIGKNTFSETGGFLQKMLSPLYLGFFPDMRKGEDN